ncbi:hypothetical protein JYU34_004726 [Plutella xylostella]|uniref:Uncharacterized protein n=1 Tax=Plutella xylostella TaxID=51655 RepID=A0ABQ7QYQ0_PLUXY|nr:hypothetical protein JYU34_004726 [Plutella xylostella]
MYAEMCVHCCVARCRCPPLPPLPPRPPLPPPLTPHSAMNHQHRLGVQETRGGAQAPRPGLEPGPTGHPLGIQENK